MAFFKSNEQRNAIVFTLILIIICIVGFLSQNLLIKRCSRTVIVVVTGKSKVFDSNDVVLDLQYKYKAKKFTSNREGYKYGKIGDRFFAKVACDYPKYCEVNWDIVVPDTLKYIPTNGWDKIPYGLDKK